MSGAEGHLRVFIVRTAAGDVLSLPCERVKVTPRGDLLGIVGSNYPADAEEDRARCVLALPTYAWVAVSDGDYTDPPPMPIPRKAGA